MLGSVIVAGILMQASAANAAASKTVAERPPIAITVQPKPAAPKNDAADPNELLRVKRIYVDSFGDDAISKEMQSMVVSALVASKRFKVTENRERADAILKGSTIEKTSQELHAYGEGTAVGGAAGSHSGSVDGSWSGGTGSVSGSSSGGFVARHMATQDSSVNTETINDARLAVRLVNLDGDVIWTSTQESKGAKYKGSSADVADRCVKQLLKDVEKMESKSSAEGAQTSSK
jgi:curli biogenesis system outer membrane secretion channel CsgG